VLEALRSEVNAKTFYDKEKRLYVVKARNNRAYLEIKFFRIKDKLPVFDKLENYDPKILNTVLHIFVNDFIKLGRKFLLQPRDLYRFRYFRMAINYCFSKGILNPEEWNMVANEKDEEILLTKRDTYDLKELEKMAVPVKMPGVTK
jgi:hypothetical protein